MTRQICLSSSKCQKESVSLLTGVGDEAKIAKTVARSTIQRLCTPGPRSAVGYVFSQNIFVEYLAKDNLNCGRNCLTQRKFQQSISNLFVLSASAFDCCTARSFNVSASFKISCNFMNHVKIILGINFFGIQLSE